MKSMMRRGLAAILTVAMLLSMLAVPAFAADSHDHSAAPQAGVSVQLDNEPCAHVKNGEVEAVKGETVEATCVAAGGTWYSCPTCDDRWIANPTPVNPDNHDVKTTTTEATCTKAATVAEKCQRVGCTYVVSATPVGTKLGPEYKMTAESVGNCLTTGEVTYKCQRANCDCPETIGGQKVEGCKEYTTTFNADGHDFEIVESDECAKSANDKLIYKAPTCTATGMVTIACKDCDAVWNIEVAAYGHDLADLVHVNADPATCLASGYYEGYYCNRFVDADQDGHPDSEACCNYVVKMVEGTPVEVESATGGKEALVQAQLGHEYVNLSGKIWVVKNADDTYTLIDAATDPKPEGAVEVDAYFAGACAVNVADFVSGHQYKQCKNGCEVVALETTPAAHAWCEDVSCPDYGAAHKPAVTEPNCTTGGYTIFTCHVCGAKSEQMKPTAPKHDFGVKLEPGKDQHVVYTYVKDGVVKLDETNQYYFTPDNPDAALVADGWEAIAWLVQKEWKCGDTGIYIHTCTKCDDPTAFEQFRVTKAHSPKAGTERQEPATCLKPAENFVTCEKCSTEYSLGTVGVALGHLVDATTGDRNATGKYIPANVPNCDATEAGWLAYYVCYDPNCDGNLYGATGTVKPIPAHQFTSTRSYEASCLYPAFSVTKCANCDTEEWETVPGQTAWEARLVETVTGTASPNAHRWEMKTPASEPTCADYGAEQLDYCTVCGIDRNDGVNDGTQIAKKTYVEAFRYVDPTCNTAGAKYKYCATCAADGLLVQDDNGAWVAATGKTVPSGHEESYVSEWGAPTGKHFIKDAVYKKNEDGTLATTIFGKYIIEKFEYVRDASGAITGVKLLDKNGNAIATVSGVVADGELSIGDCDEATGVLHIDGYKCECGESFKAEVKLDHLVDAGATPTCQTSVNCQICNKQMQGVVGHKWEKKGTFVAATCTTAGYQIWKCAYGDCTYVYEGTAVEGVTLVAGERLGSETDALGNITVALGHDAAGKVATCEKNVMCARNCGTELAPAKEHTDKVGVLTQATCTKAAFTTYTCTNENCDWENNTKKVTSGTALGHDMQVVASRQADCLLFGVQVKICLRCHVEVEYVAKSFAADKGHSIKTSTINPTCEQNGKTVKYCETCNASKSATNVAVDWTGAKAYEDVTASTEGMTATGHKNEFTATVGENLSATCVVLNQYLAAAQAAGKTAADALKCTNPNCDVTGGKVFDYNTSHDLAKGTVAATCTAEGVVFWYCLNDGCTEQKIDSVTPKLTHGAEEVKDTVASTEPTNTTPGIYVYNCKYCGVKVREEQKQPTNNIVFTATVANKLGAGAAVVNKSVIAYTISIDANNRGIYGLQMDVAYSANYLKFVGFDLPVIGTNEDGTAKKGNVFGDSTTFANAANGVVTIIAFNQNEADGMADATVNAKTELVTLYFEVIADSVVENPLDANGMGYTTSIAMGAPVLMSTDASVDFTGIVKVDNSNASIAVKKLGDITGDGVINIADVMAIKALILDGAYDARADIDQDGEISLAKDLVAVINYVTRGTNYTGFLAFGKEA